MLLQARKAQAVKTRQQTQMMWLIARKGSRGPSASSASMFHANVVSRQVRMQQSLRNAVAAPLYSVPQVQNVKRHLLTFFHSDRVVRTSPSEQTGSAGCTRVTPRYGAVPNKALSLSLSLNPVHTRLGSSYLSMSSTIPLPPREHLCNRSCRNKQQQALRLFKVIEAFGGSDWLCLFHMFLGS